MPIPGPAEHGCPCNESPWWSLVYNLLLMVLLAFWGGLLYGGYCALVWLFGG